MTALPLLTCGFTDGLVTYTGSDPPINSNGRPTRNRFHHNTISNTEKAVRIDDGDSNQIYGMSLFALQESNVW